MSEATPDNNERNPFTRPGFIVSAALIIALVAAVIVIAFLPGKNESGTASPSSAPPTASSSSSASEEESEESVCGLPGNDETALGTAPESDWELIGTMAVPSAPETAGPGVVDESGFRTCFAQTPTGALFAAANLLGLGSVGDVQTQKKLLEQLTVEGAGQQAALEGLSESRSGPSVQISGFQLLSYSDEAANVDLAFSVETGAVGHVNLPLRWVEGDWKVEVADDGEFLNDPVQLNDLNDYISWSGV